VRGDSISRPLQALAVAVCSTVAIVAALPASGADTSSSLRDRAHALAQANSVLAQHSRAAVLTLYALDTRLSRAQAALSALRAEAAVVEAQRVQTLGSLRVARHVFSGAQRNLAERLRAAYEQGDSDALSIVLGAKSIDDALSGIETLDAAAASDRRLAGKALHARTAFVRLRDRLAARAAKLHRFEASVAATARSLAAAKAERIAYLHELAARRRLNASQIGSLESRAHSIEAQARQVAVEQTALSTTGPSSAAPATGGARTLTVVATAYTLSGTTATGAPVGYGVVAVDPAVIPLGTRMTIPGYGEGVAADTGGSIQGTVIDLWFPSAAEAAAWGRRTVTISLH
jgi:peptidoglycan DL-endopeptidase CwlO